MAQHASTAVALAALAMMAPALVPGTASAQQVAANAGSEFAKCDAMSETRPKEAIACRVEVLKAKGAAADARGEAADAQVECVKEITALRRNETFGPKATEIARELVKASGRPVADIDACALRDGVRTGLTRLKLLPARVSMN